MKKTVMTLVVLILTATSVHAQTDGPDRHKGKGGKHRGDPVERLADALDLTDDQAVELTVIMEESRARHRAIQESVQAEHCAVRENTFAELASILTEEQMAQFEQMESKSKNHGRRHGMPKFANCES